MRKVLTLPKSPTRFPAITGLHRLDWRRLLLLTLIFSALEAGFRLNQSQALPPSQPLLTAAPTTVPQSLQNTLAQVDAAASKRDIRAVMKFYSPSLTHSDGLTRQTLEQSLTQFWQGYNTLNYRTQVQNWKADGKGFVVETVTDITGTQRSPQNQNLVLKATLTARQSIMDQKIVRQDVLSERSQITSGPKPPVVQVNLPKQVRVGQEYNFDAIVTEPLGDSLLLGAAVEEPINAKNYLETAPVKLEALPAGGLFKVGKAPAQATSQWLSAVLIREGGVTQVSQRLQVVGGSSPAK